MIHVNVPTTGQIGEKFPYSTRDDALISKIDLSSVESDGQYTVS